MQPVRSYCGFKSASNKSSGKEDFKEKQIVIYGKTAMQKCWDW